MKKFIALAIAILMMAVLAVPAFAATINQTTDPKTGTMTVTYSPAEGYVVTIPETLVVGNTTGVELKIESNYANALSFNVTVAGDFTLRKAGDDETYAYELKVDGTAIEAGNVITNESLAQKEKSVVLTASWADGVTAPTVAGAYTDTLTFTVTAAA